jgi:transcription initiation factor TFIIIB Brf1 subunit/transcription initiation factor TFIIB
MDLQIAATDIAIASKAMDLQVAATDIAIASKGMDCYVTATSVAGASRVTFTNCCHPPVESLRNF